MIPTATITGARSDPQARRPAPQRGGGSGRGVDPAQTRGRGATKTRGQKPTGGNAQAISRACSRPAVKGKRYPRTSGLLARIVDDPGDLGAQVLPLDHPVDEARREQELGALEALGQLLADGLLDHPRPGEADQ